MFANDFVDNATGKSFLGLVGSVLAFFWNSITGLFVILLIMIILDYITGIIQSALRGGFSWDKAWKGVVKKVLYGVVIILGFSADYAIHYLVEGFGLEMGMVALFGIAACIYLIGTEGFSIIQNLILVGVPVPPFVEKVFGLMRDNAGELVKVADVKEAKNHEDKPQ